jgi:hypothetical protein
MDDFSILKKDIRECFGGRRPMGKPKGEQKHAV